MFGCSSVLFVYNIAIIIKIDLGFTRHIKSVLDLKQRV